MDNEKKQMLIYTNPHIIKRRKEQLADEMKEKKIYGQIVEVKGRTLEKESTRARKKRLEGITSIEGILKLK